MYECEPRNFLRSCLLLFLLDGPTHGYDLIRRLHPFGLTNGDPGHVYRALRSLERELLVRSVWAPPAAGPARRVYSLTDAGHGALETAVLAFEHTAAVIERYLRSYAEHHPRPPADGRTASIPAPRSRQAPR